MSKPCPITGPRRPHRRGRGFVLTELLMALSLTAAVATVATQLVIRILGTGRTLADAEQADVSLGRAVQRLRRDTERAAHVTMNNGALNVGPATWSAEPQTLVRREGDSVDRFDALRGTPTLTATGGRVVLGVGQGAWAFHSLVDTGGGR